MRRKISKIRPKIIPVYCPELLSSPQQREEETNIEPEVSSSGGDKDLILRGQTI